MKSAPASMFATIRASTTNRQDAQSVSGNHVMRTRCLSTTQMKRSNTSVSTASSTRSKHPLQQTPHLFVGVSDAPKEDQAWTFRRAQRQHAREIQVRRYHYPLLSPGQRQQVFVERTVRPGYSVVLSIVRALPTRLETAQPGT